MSRWATEAIVQSYLPHRSVHLTFLKLGDTDPRDHNPPNVFQQETVSLVVSFQRLSLLGLTREWDHMLKHRTRVAEGHPSPL